MRTGAVIGVIIDRHGDVTDRQARGSSGSSSHGSTRRTCCDWGDRPTRNNDLNVNICREKKLTNIRAAGRDENIIISPHREMGLEEGIEWIADDELVEVTPESVRLRKKILKQTDRPRRRQEDDD